MCLPQRTVLFEVAPYAVLGEVRTVRGMTYPVVRVKRERDVLIRRHRDSKCFEEQQKENEPVAHKKPNVDVFFSTNTLQPSAPQVRPSPYRWQHIFAKRSIEETVENVF
ncbi:hypothetical protein ISCGN_007650 [Ixodes scapularis]